MIGDLVYECKGKIVSMRIKENGDAEYTAMVGGMMRGEQFSSTFSWDTQFRPDGSGYGQIRGFFNTANGEAGKYTGIGNGYTRPDGGQVHMGALCYSNPPGKFADLNKMAVAYEVNIDKDGNFLSKGWSWK
ncbi:MAG: hypothetical protein SA339_07395 [Methanomassiliicoccus sp.]|nr:hypothetical protein [Methanomassiliicoccus sp.]